MKELMCGMVQRGKRQLCGSMLVHWQEWAQEQQRLQRAEAERMERQHKMHAVLHAAARRAHLASRDVGSDVGTAHIGQGRQGSVNRAETRGGDGSGDGGGGGVDVPIDECEGTRAAEGGGEGRLDGDMRHHGLEGQQPQPRCLEGNRPRAGGEIGRSWSRGECV